MWQSAKYVSPTTSWYDGRGEQTKRTAVEKLHVPTAQPLRRL